MSKDSGFSFDEEELNKSMTSDQYNEARENVNEEVNALVSKFQAERGENFESHSSVLELMMESAVNGVQK
mgnify:CR=1 FL=1